MLKFYGVKDRVTGGFIDYRPAKELADVTRTTSNYVNGKYGPMSIYATNPEDLDLYELGEIDEETGEITPNLKFELNCSALVKKDAN